VNTMVSGAALEKCSRWEGASLKKEHDIRQYSSRVLPTNLI
jgi:hypothetical protein